MKALDTFSKRALIVAVSISLVLLSLSAFMLTVQRVTAAPPVDEAQIIGLGATQYNLYYAVGSPGHYVLREKAISDLRAGQELK